MKKEDVDKMTLQEACDYAVHKIVDQGKQCMSGERCAYQDDHGNHCAVGWLLDDADSELMTHNEYVIELINRYPQRLPKLIRKHRRAFNDLQRFHDSAVPTERREYARRLTEEGIDTSKPQYQKWIKMGESWILNIK